MKEVVMEVNAKILLDTKEYHRLLAIERKYNTLLKEHEQQGKGNTCPKCDESVDSVSKIIMDNEKKHAISTPVPGIIPSITNPLEAGNNKVSSTTAPSSPWYYLGN